jgi:hypothetical protein
MFRNCIIRIKILILFLIISTTLNVYAGVVRTANNASTLATAYSASANGDTIRFTDNITVTATFGISKSIVIDGQGFIITVPKPGLTEEGIIDISASTFNTIQVTGSSTKVSFRNLTIKGGKTSTTAGAAINNTASTIYLYNCKIMNSYCQSNGGGGIYNSGNCYLYYTAVTRNAAEYGGGCLNESTGKMFIEHSTFTENRCIRDGYGGGAVENKGGGKLYVNNSTFSNNQTSGGGGGINNYQSVCYIFNSTFSGNINTSSNKGAAILSHASGNNAILVNCLFAYNYHSSNPTSASTSFTFDDINSNNSGNCSLYYCTYFSNTIASGSSINYIVGNNSLTRLAIGSDNDIFTGGLYSEMYSTNGKKYSANKYFQPHLIKVNGIAVPTTIKTSSWVLEKGSNTRFKIDTSSHTPHLAYYNKATSTWNNLLGSPTSSDLITTDETGITRGANVGVGAVERVLDNYVALRVYAADNGTVNNNSFFADLYPSGTTVTITALANSGYRFEKYNYEMGGTGDITTNPLTLTLTTNTILTPIFVAAPSTYSITYLSNKHTGGTLPTPSIINYPSTTSATILGNTGSLVRTGWNFKGWNTQENGSGTATNLTLYATWEATADAVLSLNTIDFKASVLT